MRPVPRSLRPHLRLLIGIVACGLVAAMLVGDAATGMNSLLHTLTVIS
ncbi:MAG TPA: hypothetical protein VFI00_13730 [Kribbella sp.]|nr:hypothetical protein [Kribbella sp.]